MTLVALTALTATANAQTKTLRVGIIGCDTSHAGVFTKMIGAAQGLDMPDELFGFQVVAAYPGGSNDLPVSRDRVKKFTADLRDNYGLEIVDSVESLLPKVDVVLLLSVDGRVHLKQVEPVLRAGKPVFIDKPFAASLSDALAIVALSQQTKTPIMSSSSLRFSSAIKKLKADEKAGPIVGCMVYGPCSYAEHHPDLAFYGVHGLEMMFSLMGSGVETVSRSHTKDTDTVTCTWKDGRVATYRGTRSGKSEFGGTVFCKNAVVNSLPSEGYGPMLREIGKFFRGGASPISTEEMAEVIAVMEAADLSKTRNGAAVAIAEVMKAAQSK